MIIVPDGAIKIPLPLVRQPDDFSCGAAAALSISSYYGFGPTDLEDVVKACKTNEQHGTYYGDLPPYFRSLGLAPEVVQGLGIARLKRLIYRRIPVMLSIQAWADDPAVYDDPDSNDDGHWVNACGYDRGNIYVMDPSIWGRYGHISNADLLKRWHENEGSVNFELSHQLAIIVKPNRKLGAVRSLYVG
jgi:ABC-type bacteriocin/lantibiotic exporters, contain an N-terminal double-glycine peptidase domain